MSSSSVFIKRRLALGLSFGIALGLGMVTSPEIAQAAGITLDLGTTTAQQTSTSVQLLLLMTLLSLAPAILMMMTSFTRIIIVLSFLESV